MTDWTKSTTKAKKLNMKLTQNWKRTESFALSLHKFNRAQYVCCRTDRPKFRLYIELRPD